MVDNKATTNDKPCCKDKPQDKLVKATELPKYGNPFPPKDVVENDAPGMLEAKIRSIRTMLQPYVSPFATAYEKTHDFVSIGVSHSQSGMQRLAENQSSIVNAAVISGSGLLGILLARRRGVFKKLLYGSIFFGGAMVACYPKEAEEKAQMLLYIARNKLPVVVKQQYDKFAGAKNESTHQDKTEAEK